MSISNDTTCPQVNLKENNTGAISKIELKQIDIFSEF